MGRLARLLKRIWDRKAFRFSLIYFGAAWLILQVAMAIETTAKLPDWFDLTVLAGLALAFPVGVLLAWAKGGGSAPGSAALLEAAPAAPLAAPLVDGPAPLAALAPPRPEAVSVCVLPFSNMSGDPEQEYFSDGITEDIITDLSKVAALGVASRSQAFAFKGRPPDVREVARATAVTHVLQGSVRKSGGRVRITAQLVDGPKDLPVWAERFDRELQDIFAIQDEISRAIVSALELQLLPEERKAIEHRETKDPEAYKHFLMARQFTHLGNERHQAIAVRLCQRAVELDPDYAAAWAQLAMGLWLLERRGVSPGGGGRREAERAIALNPKLSEAHAALAHVIYSEGRYEDALVQARTAVALDPKGFEGNYAAAIAALGLRREKEAIAFFETAAAARKGDYAALALALQAYRVVGDEEGRRNAARRALERIEAIVAVEPDHGRALSFGVSALVALGEADRAKEWSQRALLMDPDNATLTYNLACAMIELGELDEAFALLDLGAEKFTPTMSIVQWWEVDSDLDPIRGDPRYGAWLAKVKSRIAAQAGGA